MHRSIQGNDCCRSPDLHLPTFYRQQLAGMKHVLTLGSRCKGCKEQTGQEQDRQAAVHLPLRHGQRFGLDCVWELGLLPALRLKGWYRKGDGRGAVWRCLPDEAMANSGEAEVE